MGLVLDAAYLFGIAVWAPRWLWRRRSAKSNPTDWSGRLGKGPPLGAASSRALIHAVSVGEVNAIRLLVQRLRQARPDMDVVVSVTTETGCARARELFTGQATVVRYPLDLRRSVRRFLDRVQPTVVVLAELEVWPHFVQACASRGIPVCVVNGRLSERSFRRYCLVRWLIAPSFRRLAAICTQTRSYAERFVHLGAPAERVSVTGTMKWDTADISDTVPGADELAKVMGIDRSKPLVVGGSTEPLEHELLVRSVPPGVQLLCAPRRPEWFAGAAEAMPGCARRSTGESGSTTGRFLLDTFGELRKAYALADVVVVGRSFGQLHGSDMMEPIALGKPVIVGPAVGDFQETAEALLAAEGMVQTSADGLMDAVIELLSSPERGKAMAERGRGVIRRNQGATAKHVEVIMRMLTEHARQPSQGRMSTPSGGTALEAAALEADSIS